MKFAVEVTPVCTRDAVLKPEVAGPIKAIGAMKHPDNITPRVVNKNNLLIIESPQFKISLYFFNSELKERIKVI